MSAHVQPPRRRPAGPWFDPTQKRAENACPVCGRPTVNAYRRHRDTKGSPCPGIPREVALTELPPVVMRNAGPEPIRSRGYCTECGARVSGERRFCGRCMSKRRV